MAANASRTRVARVANVDDPNAGTPDAQCLGVFARRPRAPDDPRTSRDGRAALCGASPDPSISTMMIAEYLGEVREKDG